MNRHDDYGELNTELLAIITQCQKLTESAELDAAEELCRRLLAKTDWTVDSFDLWKSDENFKLLLLRRQEAFTMLGRIMLESGKSRNDIVECFQSAYSICHVLGDKKQMANVLGNLGIGYCEIGNFEKSIEYYNQAIGVCEEIGDEKFMAALLHNRARIYTQLSEHYHAIEDFRRAISINEKFENKSWLANNYLDLGVTFMNISNFDTALIHFSTSLALSESLSNPIGVAKSLNAIGCIHQLLEDNITAMEYLEKSLELSIKHNLHSLQAILLINLGDCAIQRSEYKKAIEYGKQSLNHLRNVADVAQIPGALILLSYSNLMIGKYEECLRYLSELEAIDTQSHNKSHYTQKLYCYGNLYADKEFSEYNPQRAESYFEEAIRVARDYDLKDEELKSLTALLELQKHDERWREYAYSLERQIQIKEELRHSEVKKIALIRDVEYKQAEREKNLAIERAKHEATEALLHNVLPPSIAHRMIKGESLIAEKLDHVSVLFADIVNFTNLSQRITAEELVAGLDRIFSEFDALAEKHGLEKIKTIGDAYMVVSGAPVPRADHAEAMAQFALEILESMKQFTSISTGEEIQIRIGIHSGEVVAGVIGKKKFAYDLWGDAVNTAARMESHGESGRIHVSEEFMHALIGTCHDLSISTSAHIEEMTGRDLSDTVRTGRDLSVPFHFISRGEMEIKGKGKMKTYFLEKA